ncbi:hypothetical protein DAI22_07g029900 [Oryza sativa Japonica Group]|nr:hypothetical protein DAI22_07g029900 [Oryza sativa Japonica Group]
MCSKLIIEGNSAKESTYILLRSSTMKVLGYGFPKAIGRKQTETPKIHHYHIWSTEQKH